MDSGVSFLGTSEYSAHFGLGAATIADEVKVIWQNGDETILHNVPLNQTLTISPGDDCLGDFDGSGTVDGSDLAVLLGAWGSGGADLTGDGLTDAADLGVLLGAWGACP